MTHFRTLMDPGKYLGVADFPAEREVTISRIVREKLPERDGEKSQSAPMLYILDKNGAEYPRPLKVPKLLMHGLSIQYGTEIEAWTGKKVSVFAAKCMAFGAVEPCVRFRFPANVEAGVQALIRKRKVNPKAYIIREQGQA